MPKEPWEGLEGGPSEGRFRKSSSQTERRGKREGCEVPGPSLQCLTSLTHDKPLKPLKRLGIKPLEP